jgi:hypothetical protein
MFTSPTASSSTTCVQTTVSDYKSRLIPQEIFNGNVGVVAYVLDWIEHTNFVFIHEDQTSLNSTVVPTSLRDV